MTLGDPKDHILKFWGQYLFIWMSYGDVEANWDRQTQRMTWSVLEMLAHLKISECCGNIFIRSVSRRGDHERWYLGEFECY